MYENDDLMKKFLNALESTPNNDMTKRADVNSGCEWCKDKDNCPDAFCNHAVHCGLYGVREVWIDWNEDV